MRIKLKKEKQKELLNNFKHKNHFTWKEFSEFLGVSKIALIEWSRENNLLPLVVYKKLDPNNKYKNYIIEIKEDNWGQKKGGLNSKGSLKKIRVPEKNEKLAELVGIILGDGNIFSFKKGKKIRVYSLRIAGDYKKEKDYHINYIKPLCENLFNIKVKIQNFPKYNERFIALYSKELVRYLNNLGLKPGNKIKNQISIPRWIFKNQNFLKACIKGLIDTDGSIFRMSKKDPNLLRINFKNFNQKLLKDVKSAFIKLGFHPSKIICNNTLNISRKEDIAKYLKEIGFSNNKHLKRFHEFSSSVV